MKRIIFLLNILLLTTSGIYSQTSAQAGIANLKLKIGPLQYSNESRIDIVYGITTENAEQDFITALYFNFGGQFACENKSVSAIFDFGSSSGLMIAEPENFVASMMSKIVSREQKGFEIKYDFRNPIPPISLFAQEKINLRPNGKRNKVLLTMKTQCEEQLALPLTLAKFNVSGIDELVKRYIEEELDLLPEGDLSGLKVIFSYNAIHLQFGSYSEIVDEAKMRILSFDKEAKEYVLKDLKENVIERIKRST